MVIFGWVAMTWGAAAFFASLTMTLRANPSTLVPYNRNPAVVPRYAVTIRSVGAGLLVVAVAALLSSAGPWPVVIPAAIAVVGLGAIVRHNRKVVAASS